MHMSAEELRDNTCIVCPAQVLKLGQFDVTDRPGAGSRYDPDLGYRVDTATDTAVCVHPYRVGIPAGTYCSTGMPVPAATTEPPAPTSEALELPTDVTDLEAWVIAVLRAAGPDRVHQALDAAETVASKEFGSRAVVQAMRRVFSVELQRG
ncbi:MAG: hypothetical protein ABW000_07365 [Actinoplanes sp.]